MNFLQTKNRSLIILKSLFFVATLCITHFTFTAEKNSIITPLTNAERTNLCYGPLNNDGSIKYPSLKILEYQPKGTRYGSCHNFAISEKLGLKGQIPQTFPIIGTDDWHSALQFTKKYCKEIDPKIESPKPGDLVTYYAYNNDLIPTETMDDNGIVNPITYDSITYNDSTYNCPYILHTGLVHDDDMVKSKWGGCTPIVLHPTFHVPISYGTHAKYHRVIKPTDEIIKEIKETIPNFTYDTARKETDSNLVKYAEQSNNKQLWNLWQRHMCADIEACNDKGQSLVMIGAKTNNRLLVNTALQHGADLNKKDKNGKTALDLAKENKHSLIANKLQTKIVRRKNPFVYNTAKRIAKDPSFEEALWRL